MVRPVLEYVRRHHLGLIALIVALTGTAYAADTIRGRDVVPGSLKSKHIQNDAVKGIDVREDSLKGKHIVEGTLDSQVSSATVLLIDGKPELTDSTGFESVERTGVGTYAVSVEQGAPTCNAVAGYAGPSLPNAKTGGSVTLLSASPGTELTFVTRDASGDPVDLGPADQIGFAIIAAC